MLIRAFSLVLTAGLLLAGHSVSVADDAPETQVLEAKDFKLELPKTWAKKATSSQLRLAQYEIPAAEGDSESGELAVFPPFGGSASENVKRWINQFATEGRSAVVNQGKTEQGTYVIVDVSGTYNKPDGPPVRQKTIPTPGYRMFAVLLSTDSGNYSMKLTGPQKTIEAAAEAFRKSFGADVSKEEKFEF
ncbi:hypothetical protein SH668x_001953 [Planctomicrobium sp. SH668]|uniref:hypothetical protein n=1 Tax=Planctomicrobium sp. SH668 TaxID=3448126 RepID=UPI003F5C805B